MRTETTNLVQSAENRLRGYLATGLGGLFAQGWDRLNAAGLDVDLRREPTEANARALLGTADAWLANNR